MNSGWYKVDFLLPYLQDPREGSVIVFLGGQLPSEFEVREVLVIEQKIKQEEFYFVRILSVKNWEAPKQKD